MSEPVVHVPLEATNWPVTRTWKRLDQVTLGVWDCPHTTPKLTTHGPYVVRSQDVRSGIFRYDEAGRVSEATYQERIERAEPTSGDLLYSREGTYFGIAAEVPKGVRVCLGQRMVLIRPDPEKINSRFLRLWLNSPVVFRHIHGFRDGSVAERLNMPTIRGLAIPKFERDEQESIAEILGALDDKIELNRRMNETLEAMARAVFRDWFVDFGPTRRKAAGLTDPVAILGGLLPDPEKAIPLAALFPDSFGDNGLPEGWEERTITDDFDVEMGQSPPGSTYNEEGEGLPFFQGRRDFQFRFPEKRVFCSAPTRFAQADWTLISVRAPVGDINRAWEKCCIGRGVGAMMHKQGWASFTYYVGLHLQTELASYDKDGTVFGSINQKQLKGLSVIGTNSNAAKAFDDLIAPMDAMIRNNTEENQTLAATRDLTLPKLMSGELRLTGAEGGV